MKFLKTIEKAWLLAAAASLVVVLYNLVTHRQFDQQIYFPFFCALFCILIYYNVRGQRKFREKLDHFEKANKADSKNQ
jgi:membrane protein required for beta-lactamase induction